MICNKCQKELPDFGDFCPYCGTPKELPAEEVIVEEAVVEETAAEETVAEEVAVSEQTPDEATEETAEEIAQEVPVAEEVPAEEAPAVQENQQKENRFGVILSQAKEKLAQFWSKVRVTVPEESEEEAVQEAEEAPAETAPAQAAPVEAVPVRRRPSDAFNIDFPIEEEKKEASAEEAPAEETLAEEPSAEEVPAEVAPEQATAPEKKKIKPLYLALAIAGCVVLLAALVFAVLVGMGVKIGPRENDLYYKDSYAVDEKVLTKKADTVVATIGDRTLTVSQLQMYYIESIYNFYSQNYYYMSMMGMDLTTPLDQQTCLLDESMTWEQYFLDAALKTWQSYTWVEMLAQQDNYVIPEDIQAQMDQMTAQLESIALAYGYADAAEYLSAEVAPGVSLEDYVHFNNVYLICNQYINDFYTKDYPTAAEIRDYYSQNEGLFISSGITGDMGLLSSVRHILIQPQGGTADETGQTTHSEEEWAAALAEAERILEEWKVGEATEESFAELANTYTMDTGSSTTGGLYEDISIDASYVEEFRAWATDSARLPGDVEIVKTTYGYHIMYFVEGEDYFSYMVAQQLIAERIQNRLTEIRTANPVEIDYKKVFLGEESFS